MKITNAHVKVDTQKNVRNNHGINASNSNLDLISESNESAIMAQMCLPKILVSRYNNFSINYSSPFGFRLII